MALHFLTDSFRMHSRQVLVSGFEPAGFDPEVSRSSSTIKTIF